MKQDAEYREYGGIAPFKGESTWKVTEYEPQSRQVHVGDDGAMTIALEVIIAPNENGIKLIQNLNFKTPLVDIPDDADHVARAHGTTGAGGHRQNPGERQGDSGIASA